MEAEKNRKKLEQMGTHAAVGAVSAALPFPKEEEEKTKGGGGYGSAYAPAPLPSPDDSYLSSAERLQQLTGAMPDYDSRYGSQMDSLYNRIYDREPFSYSAEADPLYQQYREQYDMAGRRSMRDSMGQASALTGGYASSYSQAVGQQQYNEYMRSLTQMLPELYSQAYNRYQDEGDWLLSQYGLLESRENSDYGRYRDSVSDWKDSRDYNLRLRDQAYDRVLYMIQNSAYMPGDKMLEEAGLTRAQAEALYRSFHP